MARGPVTPGPSDGPSAGTGTRLSSLPLLLALLCPTLPGPVAAQKPTTTVRGQVVDFVTERPVAGASVRVAETARVAWTNEEGRFLLRDVPIGLRFLRVTFLGTVSEKLRLQLRPDREREVELRVVTQVLPLPPLRVSVAASPRGKLAGFHRRRARGVGRFITRADIERRAPMETSDLFRTLPGLRVGPHSAIGRTRTSISRGARPCVVEYFLDGMPVAGFHVDDIPPEDIDGIEVYRGPSELPPRFRRRLTCAAVVIWTRDPARASTPPAGSGRPGLRRPS